MIKIIKSIFKYSFTLGAVFIYSLCIIIGIIYTLGIEWVVLSIPISTGIALVLLLVGIDREWWE